MLLMVGIQIETIHFWGSVWIHIFNSVLASNIKRDVPLAKHLDGSFFVQTDHQYARSAIISHLFNKCYAASVRSTDRLKSASKRHLLRKLIVVTNVTQNTMLSHAQAVQIKVVQRMSEATL